MEGHSITLEAKIGRHTTTKKVLEEGVKPNVIDNFAFTPLVRDVSKGHKTVIKLLLKRKANKSIQKGHRVIVKLLFAALACYLAVAQLPIEKNADIGAKDIFGRDLVYWAGASGVKTDRQDDWESTSSATIK